MIKYLVLFYFGGCIKEVEIEKEGKTEVILSKVSDFHKGTRISKVMKKQTEDHMICNTFQAAKQNLIDHHYKEIKLYKEELSNLTKKIKNLKRTKSFTEL